MTNCLIADHIGRIQPLWFLQYTNINQTCSLQQCEQQINLINKSLKNHLLPVCAYVYTHTRTLLSFRHARTRNYGRELESYRLEAVSVEFGDFHPLKPIMVTESKTKKLGRKGSTSSTSSSSSSSMLDPLSSVLDGTDPLSLFAATADPLLRAGVTAAPDNARKKRDKDESLSVGSDFEPWSSKRGEILSRYTTNEKLSIVSPLLILCKQYKGKASTPGSTVSEKVRTRLEELDDLEEGSQKELLNLTQQDYTNRIEELNQSLKDAWASDQKVKALKIVIQCSKLLSDTTVIQFYPSKFVLITDILDTFGKLVFERIFSMCADHCTPLPDNFTTESVNDIAKETCLNWFFKIASIRELIPRLGISECLPRLTSMIRGIGDPLVAVYARAYLCRTLLTEMMERCRKLGNNALLLNSVMSAFRAEFIAARAMDFIGMIKECDESGFPKHLLFCSLGQNLALADPPESDRLQILNEAWKVITKLKNPQDYINCAEIWMEYTCRHFTKREVNTILADVIKHMTPDRAFEEAYPQPSALVEVCKCIMQAFIKHQQESTKDPVILNALLHVCKTMHDSVNALTLEDEKRTLASLINGFVRMVSFGRDFEQQLNFYVEARSMFCNLEPVLVQLIHACVAFCFITIPSLTGIFTRLNLYLHSGQVALANQCLSQADAFFRAAISLVPEVPKMISIDGKLRPSEAYLLEFLCNFFSTLLIVPDHPEQGVLFLVRGLLNVIQDYTWEDNSDDKVKIYTNVVHLLSAMGQETYLYHIDKVESNDTLYGGDTKFLAETSRLCETVISQILEHLKNLGKDETLKRQSHLALCFFNSLLAHADLRNNKLNQLAVNLWNLAQKHGFADTKTTVKTLEYIKLQSKHPEFSHFTELLLRLPLQSRT
uniref:VPS35 endosomal protein-sorting factor-like n=1 Tax=Pseudonaja textilis TaxID=8673 RepID=A0A670YSU9_PSETE